MQPSVTKTITELPLVDRLNFVLRVLESSRHAYQRKLRGRETSKRISDLENSISVIRDLVDGIC